MSKVTDFAYRDGELFVLDESVPRPSWWQRLLSEVDVQVIHRLMLLNHMPVWWYRLMLAVCGSLVKYDWPVYKRSQLDK